MDLEALTLLKLIVFAGLVYLTYYKTRRLAIQQQNIGQRKQYCTIKDITHEEQSIPVLPMAKQQTQIQKVITYEEFIQFYDHIRIQKQEYEDVCIKNQKNMINQDQNQRLDHSTAETEEKKEYLSTKSSSVYGNDEQDNLDVCINQVPLQNINRYLSLQKFMQKLRAPKRKSHKTKNRKLFPNKLIHKQGHSRHISESDQQ